MPNATRPSTITCARCGAEKTVGERGPIPVYCSTVCRLGNRSARRIDITCVHCGQPARVREGARYCSSRCRDARSHQTAREDGRYEAELARRREENARRREANARPCPYCAAPMTNPRRVQCGSPECKRLYQNERQRAFQDKHKAEHGMYYSRQFDRPRAKAARCHVWRSTNETTGHATSAVTR